MRHRKRGKKLGVSPAHRKALGRNMIQSLLEHERIITTVPKAKHFQPLAEKIIHLGKTKDLHHIRRAVKLLGNRDLEYEWEGDNSKEDKAIITIIQKLFDDIGPRNKDRQGGYTRILRLAKRRLGDGGERCFFELVERSADSDAGEQTEKQTPAKEAVANS